MKHLTYQLQMPGSMPDTKLVTYIQDDSPELAIRKRPLVLICPGGGYEWTSDREAESMALQFLAMGYHAAVLRYSCAPVRYPVALLEVASAMILLRGNASEWNIEEEKIILLGCSAGGHLAASYGMFWKEDFIANAIGLEGPDRELLRPNGMILCYPVITSGEFAHRDSFVNLLGDRLDELSDKMSLEHQVNDDTPQAFIWHTFEDTLVPVENSLLLVSAMRKAGIPVEFHLFPKGGHGLSLANELTKHADGGAMEEQCQVWIPLACAWMKQLVK
ncbi:MAG: alpha/beta hydrolase [Lachnospiraceae bacterium]|jgi:acetyl esterase/lipase|nr:alpha/beta hydrolase [Lachnospiraceae bacterium]